MDNELGQEQVSDFQKRLAHDMAIAEAKQAEKEQREKEIELHRQRLKSIPVESDGLTPEERMEYYRKRAKEAEKQSGITRLQLGIEFRFDKVNAPNVVKFIKAQNKKRGYELKLPFPAYLPHAKRLITTYGEQAVKAALVDIAKDHARDYVNEKSNYISLEYVETFLKNRKSGGNYGT